MANFWRFFFLCIATFTAGDIKAQVKVNLANLPKGQLESGSTHTLVLNIQNEGGDTLLITYEHHMPKPLRALVFNKKVILEPNGYKNLLVPISIPRHTNAGIYDLEFTLRHQGKIVAELKTKFEIPKRTEIEVELISRPPYARANDTIKAQFMINNTGNDEEMLIMHSRNCQITGPNSISIQPDSTIIVEVQMIPNKTLMRVDDKAIDLSCNIVGANRKMSDQEIIRIYPIRTKKIDPFLRYPISFRSNYVYRTSNGEQTLNSYQFQISGKGSLDAKKKHNLVFDYRGPGSVRITRIGNFSQKYVQYYNKKVDVFVGEKSYGLSNLTENFRFGTGVDANVQLSNRLKVGTYFNKPLLQPDIDRQYAGYILYESIQKYTYRVNGVRSELHNGKLLSLASLQTSWSDFNNWAFSTEISRSIGVGDHGNAYSFAGNVDAKGFKISSTGLYADKDFQGYYANSMFLNGSVGYNLKKVGFQIGGNFNDENPNQDTVFSASPYSIFLNSAIIGRFSKAWNLQVMALYRQKVDRLNTKRFDYQERRIRFASTYRQGFWSTRLMAEGGFTTNFLVVNPDLRKSLGYDAQIQFTYSPKSKLSLSAFSQYLSNTRFTESRFSYLLFGGDIRYKLHKKVSLEFEFQNNFLVEDLYNDRNLVNLRANFQIKKNHRISTLVNYGILHQSPIRRDWYYTASYSFLIGVPIKKLLALGSVEGQVLNKGVESVNKIVLMMDGQLVTTDEQGRFRFNNIKPGNHQLFIDKRSIGVRDMADIKLPIEVEVLPDRSVKVNFALTRSAAIRGKVNMVKVRVVQSSKEKIVMPRIVIEATNGTEKILTQTDAEGNFLFGSLRPGTWNVRLLPTYWKDQFYIKKGEFTITVAPDEEGQVSLLIEPKVRQIKFLNPTSVNIGGQ